ncbi:hypothetical protein E2C01_021485 [Portunus trituberculatus]|uniref:Uncharacterized protein n=1 Tax=Portunus trituberculatus TaxID=210409 RepID=A0A5B7E675_PORTR|nr:hypothetical protein [Portunus trituberculatus]
MYVKYCVIIKKSFKQYYKALSTTNNLK